jgi:N utilization substance protein A
VATVNLGNVEAILPRSEQIPGESLHAGERVRAVVFEVKAAGNRVRVVLSRTRPQLVQRLFEQEIPELSEGVIAINSISREPGYRSKVAVSSEDSQVDPIAVCVGYRGSRIKAVREELAGEHIDVVRYSEDPEVLIPNALQPAVVEQVLLCDMIGRAIVLVQEDQLSLAIGRRGQNVRLASKLCGWDIEIMTGSELEEQIDQAVEAFSQLEGMTPEISQVLVEQGYLSYDDLSVIEPDAFMEMSGLSAEEVDRIVTDAEEKAEEAEEAAAVERQARRERERLQREAEAAGVAEPASPPPNAAANGQPAPSGDEAPAGTSQTGASQTGASPTSTPAAAEDAASAEAAAPEMETGDPASGGNPETEPSAAEASPAEEAGETDSNEPTESEAEQPGEPGLADATPGEPKPEP